MAGTGGLMRNPVNSLRQLEDEAGNFDFYAALRRIECTYPDQPRIGQSAHPQDDAVRFAQNISLAFEPAMIASYRQGGPVPKMAVNFFGLCGANGPMPIHFSEYVRDRMRHHDDPTLAGFLNMFHHRLISLMYRAWSTAQPTVSFDRPTGDRFSAYVGSFAGLAEASLQQRDSVPDLAKLQYAGHLAARNRNAAGLTAMLSDFFKLPVRIEQFVGHWMTLPDDSRCRLRSGIEAQVLGQTTLLGSQVWNCQHKFRIEIGPLDLAQFRQMLPGSASATRLVDWVRNYLGLAFDWDVRLILKKQEVPRLALGRGASLGWTTWLSSWAPQEDDKQLCYLPRQRTPRPEHEKNRQTRH